MRKKEKLYVVLSAVAGAFICICYLNYLIVSVVTNSSVMVAATISLFVICAVVLPVLFRKQLKKLLKRTYVFFKWCYTVGMWIYVISFSAFCIFILAYDSSPNGVYERYEQSEPLVIVTFGCKTYGMTPGKALRRRLDVTLELMEHYPESITIVSGGQGTDEENTEAAAMRQYLLDHGIAEERIFTEENSRDTIENLRYSIGVIKENGLSDHPLIGVSHYYHAPRIELLAKRFGINMHLAGYQKFDFAGMTREFMAYIKLFLFASSAV